MGKILVTGLSFKGSLDISAPEVLGENDLIEFRRTLVSGESLRLPENYYHFPNIRNAHKLGLISVVWECHHHSATSGVSGYSGFSGGGVPPPPTVYASHFNTSDGSTTATVNAVSTSSRYVSAPTTEGNPFKIGGWTAGTTQPTLTSSGLAYSTTGLFSVFDNSTTTITVAILDANGVSVLASNTQTITGNIDNTTSNIRIQVTGFAADSNKYKAQLAATINLGSILPAGGRFSVNIQHVDSTDGTFSFSQNDVFRDRDTVVATIGGVTMAESVPVIKNLSGVEFYTLGSTFDVGISGIDNLNDESYPSTQVVVTADPYALPELDLPGSSLTGWTDAYDSTGDSYDNANWQITTPNYFILTTTAQATATPQDWGAGTAVNSPNAGIAIDTFQDNQTAIYENFRNETLRLKSDLTTAWDGTQSLASYDSGNGLEVLGSRLSYPQIDFTPYDPNAAGQPNYSSLSGDRYYYRTFYQTSVNHSNGTFQFGDHNITETDITNDDVRIELSLDGTNWYNCDLPYLGGALGNGDGCRINSDTENLTLNDRIQFTFGTGGFTDVGTGGGWGAWIRIKYKGNAAGMTAYIGNIQVIDWV